MFKISKTNWITAAKVWLLLNLAWIALIYWQWPDQYTHLIFCDVGQGDAILLTHGFNQVLIDAGPDDSVMQCLSDHLPFWDRQLELVIATHADQDHIGGFPSVLKNYQVKIWLMDQSNKDSATYRELLSLIDDRQLTGMQLKKPFLGQMIGLKNAWNLQVLTVNQLTTSTFLPQNSEFAETRLQDTSSESSTAGYNENDRSIVLLLTINQIKILLTGDLEVAGEQALMDQNLITKVDILKVGHHGAKTSTSKEFLQLLQPENSLIGCANNNRYGHPARETLVKLEEIGSKIWRTDEHGTLDFATNGRQYWLN